MNKLCQKGTAPARTVPSCALGPSALRVASCRPVRLVQRLARIHALLERLWGRCRPAAHTGAAGVPAHGAGDAPAVVA